MPRGGMMKRCIIIAGGDYAPIGALSEDDFVIACDRGYEYARRENIVPDLVMGDFDSYSGTLPEGVLVESFPVEKDDTDTMLAIRRAIELGCDSVRICCGIGGARLDHLYANIQSLAFAVKAGMEAEMEDEKTCIRALRPGSYDIAERKGWSLSLFSLSERCENVCITGSKYELAGGALEYSFPLGVSNSFKGDVHLSFDSGMMLMMCCRMED